MGLDSGFCFRFGFNLSLILCVFFLDFSLAFGSSSFVRSHFFQRMKSEKKKACIDCFNFWAGNGKMLDGFYVGVRTMRRLQVFD